MLEINEIDLVVHDLIGGRTAYIDEYLGLYMELFPEYVRYIPLMRRRAEKPVDESAKERWHQWLLLVRDRPVGVIGFLYNRKRNVGVLMDFAIKPEARVIAHTDGRKLARLSLHLAMEQLILDARDDGSILPHFMIAEVEHEALLAKYMEYGYLKFPIKYYEPPYPSELIGVSVPSQNLDKIGYKQMYLGAFQFPGCPFNPKDPEIIKTALFAMLVDHYDLPIDHWLMQTFNTDP